MQYQRTHVTAQKAVYGGLALDIMRLHAHQSLTVPRVGLAALGLPNGPDAVRMGAWNSRQLQAGALAMRTGAYAPALPHGLEAIGGSGVGSLAQAASDLRNASGDLHKPLPAQRIELVLKLPNGMTIGTAEVIVQRSISAQRSQARSQGSIPTSPREPAAFSTLEPFLPTH